MSIGAGSMETEYPENSIVPGSSPASAQSKSYAFFIEVITKGQTDKGGRCPDGTITVARKGDDLVLSWSEAVKGHTIVAMAR